MSIPIVVLGDSIQWGQGLLEPDKLYNQVRSRVAGYSAPFTFSPDPSLVDLHVYAHSGAAVLPGSHDGNAPLWGEVPVSPQSIIAQLGRAKADLPAVVAGQPCLVLVDGGINDLSLPTILTVDPTITNKPAWVSKLTQQDIGPRMEQLLTDILAAFPNAYIIVTGYFQILSEYSTPEVVVTALSNLLGSINPLWSLLIAPSISSLVQQCVAFYQQSLAGLQTAVAAINAAQSSQRIFLAVPAFGPHNALGADMSYLWNGTDDPLYSQRGAWYSANLFSGATPWTPFASIGHPNVLGELVLTSAVKTQLIRCIRSLGQPQHLPSGFSANEDWTHGAYYGSRGTFFADVTGNGLADAIVVNDATVTVRRSNGSQFTPNEDWTHGAYYGSRGTYFADVDGDGRADAIVVNNDKITVRRSTGTTFGPNESWTNEPYYGSQGTYFADVDGDGRADAIVVNNDKITVRRSTSSAFGAYESWTSDPFFGSRGTYFADVDGDGRADAIAVTDTSVLVRRSTGSGFGPVEDWTHGAYYGSRGTFFADVTGDGRADAIVVNDNTVTIRRSS